jgi:hypothetical protein
MNNFTPPPPPPPGVNVNVVYGNLKSENSQDYARKPQQNCSFMSSTLGWIIISHLGNAFC